MSRGSAMSNWPRDDQAGGANADSWDIDLPIELRGNDTRLRATAANLLELAHVRSVIIDGSRSRVVVRLRSNQTAGPDLGTIPNLCGEPSTTHDGASDLAETSVVCWTDPRDESLCFVKMPGRAQGWRRVLLMAAAGAALLLGLLGIILPGLPTTPFVLVASYCLLRSSPRLHARLLESRLFGDVLRDWHLHRGIRRHVRFKAMMVIALVLGASLLLTSLPLAVKLLILAIAICGVTYVWRLPDVAERVSRDVL
jgi:uncharacterized membrane protein YbaN (DUF454 family)